MEKMEKPEMRIRELEERLNGLNRERERARRVLDDAVDALSLSAFLGESGDIEGILEQTGDRVGSLLKVDGMAFFLLSEDGLDFSCLWNSPPERLADLEKEKDLLVEDGTVAWALRRNRPVMVTSSGGCPILIHSVMAQEDPLGIMIAFLNEEPDGVMDISLAFVTVLLGTAGGIIKNIRLYRVINDLNDELREKVRNLEESKRELAEANNAKSRFLANVSHEIRTPLNAILGTAVIARGKAPEETDRFLEVIRKEGSALLGLINDLLDLSKIESGHMELDEVPFDLAEILDGLDSAYRGVAESRSLSLTVASYPPGPLWVMGDPIRLRQVMSNLLDNAVKFTHSGGVSLKVSSRKADSVLELDFSVADTGIGISEEGQSRLFNSFSQADSSMNRRYGGTGLGLAISQRIVRSMGGAIEVKSVVGEGTNFSFSLALPPCEPHSSSKTDGWNLEDREPLSILLVEDNETNRIVAEAMLRKAGQRVTSVQSGREALVALTEGSFDIVFMDIQMPGMDGIETAAIIRDKGSFVQDRGIPIVALTANVMSGDRERYVKAGMEEYLPKPLLMEDLLPVLSRFAPRNGSPVPRSYVLDRDGLVGRMGGDRELTRMVVDTFASDLGNIVAALTTAVESGDLDEIRRQGHALKGASSSAGAYGLKVIGHRLQRAAENGDRGIFGLVMDDLRSEEAEFRRFLTEEDEA